MIVKLKRVTRSGKNGYKNVEMKSKSAPGFNSSSISSESYTEF